MDLRQLRGVGSKQLRQLVPGTAYFLLSRAFRRLYAESLGKIKKTREEATAFLLLPPPGTGELTQPSRPGPRSGAALEGPGTSRFTKPLGLKSKRRSARCPRVVALVQLHPPQTNAPASWRLTLPWVSPGAGWWVTGATGRANCAC
jgi:hypothetical protein